MRLNNAARGSYTVEASLILFFMICIILGMIYIGFYEHDRQVIESVCVKEAEQECRYMLECCRREDGIIDWEAFTEKSILWRILDRYDSERLIYDIQSGVEEKLLASRLSFIEADVKAQKIEISYTAEFQFPGQWMAEIFGRNKRITFKGQVTAEEMESEEFIRLCKAIKVKN